MRGAEGSVARKRHCACSGDDAKWYLPMTQDEKWMIHYNEVKTFIETYHRNPSKYVDSERGLRNWVKQQKKLMNVGALEGQLCTAIQN